MFLPLNKKQALSKLDLSAKSAVYRAALENEVAVKTQNSAATLNAMRTDVKAAAVKMESARADALAAKGGCRTCLFGSVQGTTDWGTLKKIAIATKKMEAAEDNAAIARKTALATNPIFTQRKNYLKLQPPSNPQPLPWQILRQKEQHKGL